jgi:hypothetical protein
VTRGELITLVSAKLGLDSLSGSEELALMQGWAKRAAIDVLLRTHCRVEVGDMALSAGASRYRTDSNILAALDAKVTVDSRVNPYRVVEMDEILDMERAVSSADGASFVAFEGDLMAVYPAHTTTTTIQFTYISRPTAPADDSSDFSVSTYGGIPDEYSRALEYYMLWQGAEYDEKKAAPLSAKDYRQMYEDECKLVHKHKRGKAGRRLSPLRVGYPHAGLSRRNDAYPER